MASRDEGGRKKERKSARARAGGTPPDPDEAEVIGAQLWAAFAHGAGISRIPPEVVRLGRRLSGPHVRRNLEHLLGDPKHLRRTLACAEKAGRLARCKTPEAHPPTVDEFAFADAWQEVADEQKETLDRLRRVYGTEPIRGGAC